MADLSNEVEQLDEALDVLRETYEMLRDSTPGPIGEDWPVTLVLRRAKTFLDTQSNKNENADG